MEHLVQAIIKFDVPINTIISIMVILVPCYLFYSRSGSTYSLYHRLWSLLVGEKGFHDANLEGYMQERKDLDKFNAIFNTGIKTKGELDDFYKWITNNNIDIKKISAAKGNFDFGNMKMRKPRWDVTYLSLVFSIVIFIFGSSVGLLGVIDKAMLKFQKNEPWVFINHEMAKSLFNSYIITPKSCLKENLDVNKVTRLTELSPRTIKIICESFGSESDKKAIDKFISGQKSLLLLSIFSIYFSFVIFIFSVRRICARDCRGYIKMRLTNNRG